MVGILDWALIIIYMLSMVLVGVYFKTNDNMSDFAVADKKLGLSVLTATLLATAIGGGSLTGSVGNSFASGLLEVPKIIILLGINLFMALKRCAMWGALPRRNCWAGYTVVDVRRWADCFALFT